jgi:hypothetical protein
MENSGIIKQAKSDIFKVLHPIITFYINKGAKPASLKKYYKNNKRFSDLLSDINNKGINLVKDEKEYEKLVREILSEVLDDFIAKDKDTEYKTKQESKMKHIKEFHSFAEFATYFCSGLAIWGFINTLLTLKIKSIMKKSDANEKNIIASFLVGLHNSKNLKFYEKEDGYYTIVRIEDNNFGMELLKREKKLIIDSEDILDLHIQLNEEEYSNFLKIIKKDE